MDTHFTNNTLPKLRLFVIGPPGSGKTTLANGLSKLTGGRAPVLNTTTTVLEYMQSDMSLQDLSYWSEILYDTNLQLMIKKLNARVETEADLKNELIRQTEQGEEWPSLLFGAHFHKMLGSQKGGWILECTKRLNLEWTSLFGYHGIPYPADLAIALHIPDKVILERARTAGKSADQLCRLSRTLDAYYNDAKEVLISLGFMKKVIYEFADRPPDILLKAVVEHLQKSVSP